ncbi:MAG: methionine--tRNA ligase [Caldilineae bacterium]|nr:methionine--tRNA ligase [Caldilineae bacterium]
MSKFYVTTPIYYVNGAPHIGHAYTTVVADALARHYRQRGDAVFFMTGTDDHGLKVQRAAEEAGQSPKALADRNSAVYAGLFEQLGLTHDRFIRTTDPDHEAAAVELVRRMQAAGDIYLGHYEGWYAASDEAFYDASEIEDGHARGSGAKVEWVQESSYFFRLSRYAERLLAWYADPSAPVQPESRRNEVASFVASGLKDLSISRTTFDWGVAWPDDPEHVLYVWVDALTNYLTGAGAFADPERMARWWPADLHLIGKDILRFHAVYWPAFLMSAGLDLPRQVLAHGWWVDERGEKGSKSKGNVVEVWPLLERYTLDSLRYFLLREKPLATDGVFSERRLVERNNNELADNLGNLVNRVLKMVERYEGGIVPDGHRSDAARDQELRERCQATRGEVEAAIDAREPNVALEAIFALSSACNLYVNDLRPWDLAKSDDPLRLSQVLYHALESIRQILVLAAAFLPDASRRGMAGLSLGGDAALAYAGLDWGGLPVGARVKAPALLFEKIDLDEPDAEPTGEGSEPGSPMAHEASASRGPVAEASAGTTIGMADFERVELRIGAILAAEPVTGADRLLRLSVDLGEASGPRQIVAGIAESYAPAALIGCRVAVVANLAPARIRGVESQGMLLAAQTAGGGLELAQFGQDVPLGTRIR